MGEMPHIDSRTRRAVMKGEQMKKKLLAGILAVSMVGALLTGCGKGSGRSRRIRSGCNRESKGQRDRDRYRTGPRPEP